VQAAPVTAAHIGVGAIVISMNKHRSMDCSVVCCVHAWIYIQQDQQDQPLPAQLEKTAKKVWTRLMSF
jgi:hypothetical protein